MDRATVWPPCKHGGGKTDSVNPPTDFEANGFEILLVFMQGLGPIQCIIEEHIGKNELLWICVKSPPRMDTHNKASNDLFTVGALYSSLRFSIDWCQILEIRFPLSFHFSL